MSKDRRLGKGLAALLGSPVDKNVDEQVTADEPAAIDQQSSQFDAGEINLSVYEIDDNPFQPRRDFSEPEIVSLAESLKEHDMLQPVLVRRTGSRYQLISGERRLRAAIKAGWSSVPARVREADDRLVAELAIVENLQRQDLNAIEKALSFKRYLEQHHSTQEELAQRLKIDRSTIANLMRLLELPAAVQASLRDGNITAGHARALLPLGEEPLQIEFCDRIQRDGWSVRETEKSVSDRIREEDEGMIVPFPPQGETTRSSKPQIDSLEKELRVALGTKVEIKKTAKGKGRVIVHFANHEEFHRLFDLLAEGPGGSAAQVG